MPISVTSQKKLIDLIANASSISDADKEEFVAAVESGEPSPEMITKLAKAFYGESQAIDGEIANIDALAAHQEQILSGMDDYIEPGAKALVEEHEAGLKEITTEFAAECKEMDKELGEGLEADAGAQEAKEADAIRESLKQKPSENEQA